MLELDQRTEKLKNECEDDTSCSWFTWKAYKINFIASEQSRSKSN